MQEQETKTQHTPGPWSTIHETAGYITVTGPSGFGLAEVDEDDTFDQQEPGEAEANARLIAAAPDLLAALEELKAKYEEVVERYFRPVADAKSDPRKDTAWAAATDAIAKAVW